MSLGLQLALYLVGGAVLALIAATLMLGLACRRANGRWEWWWNE